MDNGQRVLVVDGLTETEEVLRAILEPRGCRVDRIRRQAVGHCDANIKPPNVIVIHESASAASSNTAVPWHSVPRVVIGAERTAAPDERPGGIPEHHLTKPFEYSELLQAVERCLQSQ